MPEILRFPFWRGSGSQSSMPEIAEYVKHGAESITPTTLANVMKYLPLWKAEYAQINAPEHPHLVEQLLFLADVVEDVAEGAYKEFPYVALAESIFALTYAHKHLDIIPDNVPKLGRADDSSVVRAVLIRHTKALGQYASTQGVNFEKIAKQP